MLACFLARQDLDLGFKTSVEVSCFFERVVVSVIGSIFTMMVRCVGSWAHFQSYPDQH
jgi:hypothetical protein